MVVDAVSYLGNILGKSSNIPTQRIILQLLFSTVSVSLLLCFNATTNLKPMDGIRGIEGKEEEMAAIPIAKG
jgi:hypothetical protein